MTLDDCNWEQFLRKDLSLGVRATERKNQVSLQFLLLGSINIFYDFHATASKSRHQRRYCSFTWTSVHGLFAKARRSDPIFPLLLCTQLGSDPLHQISCLSVLHSIVWHYHGGWKLRCSFSVSRLVSEENPDLIFIQISSEVMALGKSLIKNSW